MALRSDSPLRPPRAPRGTYFAPLTMREARRVPPAVRATIERFAARPDVQHCASALGAYSNCGVMSARFARFARSAGHQAEVFHLERAPHADHERLSATALPQIQHTHPYYWHHHVVRLDGQWLVDWTARQFDPAAPHPLIRHHAELDASRGWGRATLVLPADQPMPATVVRHLVPLAQSRAVNAAAESRAAWTDADGPTAAPLRTAIPTPVATPPQAPAPRERSRTRRR